MTVTGTGRFETREFAVPGGWQDRGIPVRAYEPETPWATLVWAHGGSFVHGTLDWPEADWVSQRFAEAGLTVYSVDYLLASETVKAPAPSDEVETVLAWVAGQHDRPLAIGGASAGAHLAVLAALGQHDALGALILEYPTLHRVQRDAPEIAAATAKLPAQRRFDAGRIAGMYDFYLGTAPDPVIVGELPSERLALLPPTVIVNAEADDLRASAEQFAEQLREAGVPVVEQVQPATVHGYLNRPEESAQARQDAQQTIDFFVDRLRELL